MNSLLLMPDLPTSGHQSIQRSMSRCFGAAPCTERCLKLPEHHSSRLRLFLDPHLGRCRRWAAAKGSYRLQLVVACGPTKPATEQQAALLKRAMDVPHVQRWAADFQGRDGSFCLITEYAFVTVFLSRCFVCITEPYFILLTKLDLETIQRGSIHVFACCPLAGRCSTGFCCQTW